MIQALPAPWCGAASRRDKDQWPEVPALNKRTERLAGSFARALPPAMTVAGRPKAGPGGP